jgi:O-methyltransferase involved in polyketide biosynthesis
VDGSVLIFTYINRDALEMPSKYTGSERVFAALQRAGEQMTFGLDPAESERFLRDRGFTLELDIGAADYRRRYIGPSADRIRGHEFYRVAVARVAHRAPTPS